VLAAAHITGGGLFGNLQRVIPDELRPAFTFDWPVPPIFPKIQSAGGISEKEMRAVFNLGIGIAMIAHRQDAAVLRECARSAGFALLDIGALSAPADSPEPA
jgi:phosphoribosylformylglycinamidine cyclo-ligase